jgi:hypothetical protein
MASPEARIIEGLLRIPNKEGEDVDFVLNSAQRAIDRNVSRRDLIPKARQEGVSSYYLARFLSACLMYRNTRAVVISHDMESTQRLLSRVKYYIENIRGPGPVVQNMSKNEITFPKTNSMFYLGTAGARKFGRGDTITHLHCSEYAYWPNPAELMKGLLQAVPMSGEIGIESTGNGYNDYYRRCMRAYEGKSVWRLHFLPWHTFDEYQLELDEEEKAIFAGSLNSEWDEPDLLKAGVSLNRLAWRRMKLDELDYDVSAFRQEYPMTLDECFQMSSASVFHAVRYKPTSEWEKKDVGYWVLEGRPQKGKTYVLGADVAAGVGKDSSTIEVFCVDDAEQVAEYTSSMVDPEVFASKIVDVGLEFNTAYAVVEQNNHGILTLARLRDMYPINKIHSTPATKTSDEERRLFGLGYRTTSRTKPLMIGKLRTLLAKDWTIHSPLLKGQLSTFIEHDNGRLGAQDGCEDDLVIGAACAGVGLNRAALFMGASDTIPVVGAAPDPFLLDNIIKELRGRGYKYPIEWQHADA